jgi:hypothetical protein
LGARERSDALVKTIVMENDDPWLPLLIERQSGEKQLFAKQVTIEEQRYVVCRNETEAEKDRKDREAIVAALDAQLGRGDKAVGNWAYRHETKDKRTFKIDAGSSPRRLASMASSCCVPTPRSRRCKRCCDIGRSRTSPKAQSITEIRCSSRVWHDGEAGQAGGARHPSTGRWPAA